MSTDASTLKTKTWSTRSREGVSVHAVQGSYGERSLERELEEAVRALEELVELLEPPSEERETIDVYLIDTLPASVTAAPTAAAASLPVPPGAVVRYVHPDTSGEPLAWPLTRFLAGRWYGERVATSGPIVDGIAGVVAGRIGSGPSEEDADRIAYEIQLAAERPPPSEPGVEGAAAGGAVGITDRHVLATSFVAYLLRTHRPEALRTFLAEWDVERRDEAALAAYSEPLASLEESWRASLQPESGAENTFRRLGQQLVPLLRANWRRQLELSAYTLLDAGFSIAIPLITALFINELTAGNDGAILPFMLLLIGSFLLLTPIGIRRAYAGTVLSQQMLFQLQHQVFDRLLRLPHSFHGRSNIGDLMARMTTDVDRVRGAVEAVLQQAVYSVIKGVAGAAVLFFIDPLLAALTIATVPLSWIAYLALKSRVEDASFRAQNLFGEVGTATHESLSAHSVIKAFGLEERTLDEYRARTYRFFHSVRRLVTLGSTLDASSSMAVTVAQLIVLGVGGYRVSQGDLQIGFLLMFIQTLPMFFEASNAITGLRRTVTEASGAMDRVVDVLEEPMLIEDSPGAAPLQPVHDEIRLENVAFGYTPGQRCLDGVNLTIPVGSNVAIVGPSGCGKTTILNLILRFWDPDEGRVLFDGQDIRNVTLASLRGQIGLVFQETFVFDTTLRENVAIARPGATDEEIVEAVRAARLDAYVDGLPDGYDTVVGERGTRMSGGQRQRLAIARALVRDPRILVLDEATSALDPATEAEVQETLRELSHGRTTISITHRLASVADSDHVFVIEAGRLVEEGTHEELMANRALYFRLYEEQLSPGAPGSRRVEVEAARLRAIPLFAELPADALGELAERIHVERFGSGDTLVRQGDDTETLYLVVRGRAEVVARETGAERLLATLNESDSFGIAALFTNDPSPVTVRALTDVEVYTLSRGRFESLAERDPRLAAAVAAALQGPVAAEPA